MISGHRHDTVRYRTVTVRRYYYGGPAAASDWPGPGVIRVAPRSPWARTVPSDHCRYPVRYPAYYGLPVIGPYGTDGSTTMIPYCSTRYSGYCGGSAASPGRRIVTAPGRRAGVVDRVI
eukprot:768800-Hanusia_phi.AAC.4